MPRHIIRFAKGFVLSFLFAGFLPLVWGAVPESPQTTIPEKRISGFVEFSGDVGSQGSFNSSFPVSLPPGTAGFAPSLGLSYSSDGGVGALGQGWSVPISCVERRGRAVTLPDGTIYHGRGAPEYNTYDEYYLDGDRLIACGSDGSCAIGTSGTYRTEFDRFAQVTHPTSDEWKVTERDGTAKSYRTTWSRDGGSSTYYRWCLTDAKRPGDTSTASARAVSYTYRNPLTYGPELNQITYGQQDGGSLPGTVVVFEYENRPDPRRNSLFGRVELRDQRVLRITVHANSATGQQLSQYNFTYTPAQDSGPSLLTGIQACGKDCTSAQSYSYAYGSRGTTSVWEGTPPTPGSGSVLGASTLTADMNGDGLPDIYNTQTNVLRYNLGNGTFATSSSSVRMVNASALQLAWPLRAEAGRFTGGKATDILISVNDPLGTIRKEIWRLDESFTPPRFVQANFDTSTIPLFWQVGITQGDDIPPSKDHLIDLGARLADLNGDGLMDILVALEFGEHSAWINRGNRFERDDRYVSSSLAFSKITTVGTTWTPATPPHHIDPTVVSVGQGSYVIDINGDGLDDVVQSITFQSKTSPQAESCGSPSGTLPKAFVNTVSAQFGISEILRNTGKPGTGLWEIAPLSVDVTPFHISETTSSYGSICANPYNPDPADYCAVHGCTFNVEGAGTRDMGYRFADINRDGLPDIVLSARTNLKTNDLGTLLDSFYAQRAYLGNGLGNFPQFTDDFGLAMGARFNETSVTSRGSSQTDREGSLVDVDGDRGPDLLFSDGSVYRSYASTSPKINRLVQITNPLGGKQFVQYKAVSNSAENADLPYPKIVVDRICISDGTGTPSIACSQDRDQLTEYHYAGGFYDRIRRSFGGFRYVKSMRGHEQSVSGGAIPYRQVGETWYSRDWCNPGQPEFSLASSMSVSRSSVHKSCEHRDASWNYNTTNPQTVLDPAQCTSSGSQILSSTLYGLRTCPAYSDTTPAFFPIRSKITTTYDPATPSTRASNQEVYVYEAADLARGRMTETCVYDTADPARTTCGSGYASKKRLSYADITSATWPLDRVCKAENFDNAGTLFRTEKSYFTSTGCSGNSLNNFFFPTKTEVLDRSNAVVRRAEVSYNTFGNPETETTYSDLALSKKSIARRTYYREALPLTECLDLRQSNGTYVACTGDTTRYTAQNTYDATVPYQLKETKGSPDRNGYSLVTRLLYDGQNRETSRQTKAVALGNTFDSSGSVLVDETITQYFITGSPTTNRVRGVTRFASSGTVFLTTDTYVDGSGRKTKTESWPSGGATSFIATVQYHELGSPYLAYGAHRTLNGGYKVETTYDRFGREYQAFHNASLKSTNTYTVLAGSGVQTSVNMVNPARRQWARADTLGRRVYSGDSEVETKNVRFEYDTRGNVSHTYLAGLATAQMAVGYDDLGQKVSLVDKDLSKCANPNNCPWTYAYDNAGQLLLQTDAKGNKTRFLYDYLGRKIWRVNCSNNTGTLATEKVGYYEYDDPLSSRLRTELNLDPTRLPTGSLVNSLNALCPAIAAGETSFLSLLSALGTVSTLTASAQMQREYTYTNAGTLASRMTIFRLPVNSSEPRGAQQCLRSTESMAYVLNNIAGAPKTVGTINHSSTDGGTTWSALTGDTVTITYDSFGRESARKGSKTTGGTSGYENRVTVKKEYDVDTGKLWRKSLGMVPGLTTPAAVVTYAFETGVSSVDRDRLRSIAYAIGGRTYTVGGYQYDAVGNVLSYNVALAGTGTVPSFSLNKSYTYDELNQLQTYTYSALGKPAFGGTFVYDTYGNRVSGTREDTPVLPASP